MELFRKANLAVQINALYNMKIAIYPKGNSGKLIIK